jgi:hypothetical protein
MEKNNGENIFLHLSIPKMEENNGKRSKPAIFSIIGMEKRNGKKSSIMEKNC